MGPKAHDILSSLQVEEANFSEFNHNAEKFDGYFIHAANELYESTLFSARPTSAEDAEEAISRGVSAILVSNHGGRQLDGVPATVEVLPGVVAAVRGRIEVYVDGGIRRGTDVIKALALGAKVVFVGRPAIWGLAYKGEAGINQMLEILREEIDRTLVLMGCSSLDQLRPDMVVHESHFSKPSRFLPATSNGSD